MMYHAPSGGMIVPLDKLKLAAETHLWALKNIRQTAKLPLDRYAKEPGRLGPPEFAQIAVIEAAQYMGIDLGVTPHNFHKLDLREVG